MTDSLNTFYVALVEDKSKEYMLPAYDVYFINNTDQRIKQIIYDTGGYASADDQLIQAIGRFKDLGDLDARSSMIIDREDEGSFDFTIWWRFKLIFDDEEEQTFEFCLPKYSVRASNVSYTMLPILNVQGKLIQAS